MKRAVNEFRASHGEFGKMADSINNLYVHALKEVAHFASLASSQVVKAFKAVAGSALGGAGPVGRAATLILGYLENIETGFKLLSGGADLHSWAEFLGSVTDMMPGMAGAVGTATSFMVRSGERLGRASQSNIGKIVIALILLAVVATIVAKKFDISFGDIARAIRRARPAALVFRSGMFLMRSAASAAADHISEQLGETGEKIAKLAADTKTKAKDFANSLQDMVQTGRRLHSLQGAIADLGNVISSSVKIGLSAVASMVGVMTTLGHVATMAGAGITTMAVTSSAAMSGMALKTGAVLGALGAAGAVMGGMVALASGVAVAAIAKIGIKALAEMPKVEKAFEDLKNSAKADLQDAASVMQPQLLAAVGQLKTAMSSQIAPALTGMFTTIAPLLTQFTAGVSSMLTPLLPAVTGLVQAAAPLLSGLAGSLGTFGQQLAGFLQPLSGALASNSSLLATFVTGVGSVLQALGPLLAALVQTAGTVLGPLAGALAQIGTALSQTLGAALVTLAPQLGQIISSLGQFIAAVLPILPPVMQLGATLATTLLPVLVQLAQTFMTALQPVMTQLQPIFAGLVKAFADMMTAALPLVGPIVQIAGTLATAFLPVVTSLVPVISQIAQVFAGVLVQAVQILVTAFTPLMPVITQLVQVLGGVLASVLAAIAPLFVQIAGLVASLVPPFLPLLQLVAQFAGQLGGVLAQGFTVLVSALAPLFPVLTQLGQILGAALTQAMSALLPAVLAIVKAFMGILPAVGPLVKILADLLMAFMPLIQQILPVAGQLLASLAPIATTLAQAIVAILPGVTGLLGLLAKLISLVLPPVISLVMKLVEGLTGFLVQALTGVVTGVSKAVKGILKPFEWLYDVLLGHSIIPDIVNGTVRWFTSLPGKVVGVLKGIGSWLTSHGRDLIEGLKRGVQAAWGKVKGWFSGLINQLPQWVKDILGIHSPSTVMAALGSDTMKGLVVGLTGEEPKIKDTIKKLTDAVKAGFAAGLYDKNWEGGLLTRIQKDNKLLSSLADERAKIVKTIADAIAYAQQTADSIKQSANIGGTDWGDGGPTAGKVKSALSAKLQQIKAFASVIKKLAAKGLNKSILQQVIDAGPEGGTELGQAILSASASDFKAINSTAAAIDKAAKAAGKTAADAMFDAGKNAGKGFLTGLKSQQKEIEKMMQTIARSLVNTIKKELKMKSPSRVFSEIGGFSMQGLALGLRDAAPAVMATATGIAGRLAQSFGGPLAVPKTANAGGPGTAQPGHSTKFEIHNYYPQAEPTSKSMNRGLQYAASVGLAS
ncbi:hypothetical protein AB0C10_15760 [Microbispora amethystogenes]|uniref:phage tail protein n=1 Tax=Microbispora amethystogenes TaxID=1427754 RepID=UPI00340C75F5